MDMKELENLISMGSSEEEVLELLRQASEQDALAESTRGNDYLMNAGRMKVANPLGAISDMFVRGNAEKKAKEAREEAAKGRRVMDQQTMSAVANQMGGRQGVLPLDAPTGAPQVKPPAQFPMPQAPQVPPPPAAPA